MATNKRKASVEADAELSDDCTESGKRGENVLETVTDQSQSIIDLVDEDEEIVGSVNGSSSSNNVSGSDSSLDSQNLSSSSSASLSSSCSSSCSPSSSSSSSTAPTTTPTTTSTTSTTISTSDTTSPTSDQESPNGKEELGVPVTCSTVNYKRILMERLLLEPTRCPAPVYVDKTLDNNRGHEAVLTFVLAGMETVIVGRGMTPKTAEQDAARQAIEVYATLRASAPAPPPSQPKVPLPSAESSSHRRPLRGGREETNFIANLYARIKKSYSDPAMKPAPEYYSYTMNGQRREWETTLNFKLGDGKAIRSVGRGPSKIDSERDAARRALDKPW